MIVVVASTETAVGITRLRVVVNFERDRPSVGVFEYAINLLAWIVQLSEAVAHGEAWVRPQTVSRYETDVGRLRYDLDVERLLLLSALSPWRDPVAYADGAWGQARLIGARLGSPLEVVYEVSATLTASGLGLKTLIYGLKRVYGLDLELRTHRQELRQKFHEAKRLADEAADPERQERAAEPIAVFEERVLLSPTAPVEAELVDGEDEDVAA